MRLLALTFKIILFLLLLGFAAKNSETVDVRYFMGLEWHLPLSLLLLIAVAFGALMGLFGCFRRLSGHRRELKQLRATLRKAPAGNTDKH